MRSGNFGGHAGRRSVSWLLAGTFALLLTTIQTAEPVRAAMLNVQQGTEPRLGAEEPSLGVPDEPPIGAPKLSHGTPRNHLELASARPTSSVSNWQLIQHLLRIRLIGR
jgi:hypothetical protein